MHNRQPRLSENAIFKVLRVYIATYKQINACLQIYKDSKLFFPLQSFKRRTLVMLSSSELSKFDCRTKVVLNSLHKLQMNYKCAWSNRFGFSRNEVAPSPTLVRLKIGV